MINQEESNKVSKDKNLNYFSFKTLIVALRRNNLLKAFDAKKSEAERNEGLKTLKAYKNMLELKGDMGGSKKNRSKSYFNKNLLNQL